MIQASIACKNMYVCTQYKANIDKDKIGNQCQGPMFSVDKQ